MITLEQAALRTGTGTPLSEVAAVGVASLDSTSRAARHHRSHPWDQPERAPALHHPGTHL